MEIDVPPVANAVNYNASVTCASNATMQNIGIPVVLHMQFDSSCTSSDIFIAAVDGTGTILGGFFAQAQPTTDGAVWTLSGDPLAATAVATSFANVPANFTTVKSNNQLADGLFTMSSSTGVATVVDGTASFTATLAPPTSGLDMVNLFNATSTSGETFLVAKRTAPSTSVSFDYSTLAVPQLSSLPTFDVPSTTLSWTESGSGTADLSVVALTINTDATRAFQWEIIGPHTGASIALPTLPTSLAQFTPLSTDTIVVNEGAVATVTGGYDALRSVVFSVNLNKVQIARAVRHLGDTLIESVFVAGTN